MARTALPVTQAPGPYAGAGVVLEMAGADTVNKNQFRASGRDLVIAHNTGTVVHNVTITSEPDPYGRVGHIGQPIQPGQILVFGPLALEGWMQPDGNVYLEADSAGVRFGVIRL